MKIDDVKKVCVAGAGLMGKEIALNTAMYGYEVNLTDVFPEALQKAADWAKEYLTRRVSKGKMEQKQADETLARFHTVESLADAAKDADMVIEAIIEKPVEKEKLFKELNQIVRSDTILATNSSFMPSSQFAKYVDNPARLANLHYFSPAIAMKLTEVVRGPHTGDDTIELLMEFSRRTGKRPVLLQTEIDGFIVNRFYLQSALTALELLDKKIATIEDIDVALETGLNHPLGIFRLMDFTGVDLVYHILTNYKEQGMEIPGYELVEEKYKAGYFGRKTGRGWYDYTEQKG